MATEQNPSFENAKVLYSETHEPRYPDIFSPP